MDRENTVDMSSEAVTGRIKRSCELSNFARSLIFARSAAALTRAIQPSTKEQPTPKEDNSKPK
jgi:hypothetical protein